MKKSSGQFKGGIFDAFRQTEEEVRRYTKGSGLPKQATAGSAGYDFYTPIPLIIQPGETVKIPTGIRVKMDPDWVLKCYPRSGLGFKYRFSNNTVGIIDSDYYGSDNEGHFLQKLTSKQEGKVVDWRPGRLLYRVFSKYRITVDDLM